MIRNISKLMATALAILGFALTSTAAKAQSFTGNYPVEIPRDQAPHQLRLFDAADHLNGAPARR